MDEELLLHFEQFKISAIDKVRKIDQNATPINDRRLAATDDYRSDRLLRAKRSTASPHVSESNLLPLRHILKELEIQRQEKVKDVIQAHMHELQEFSCRQLCNKKQEWEKRQQALKEDMQQKESSIFQALSECDKNNLKERTKLVQRYHELAERRKVHETELKSRERRIQSINTEILDNIKKRQQEFCSVYEQLIPIIKLCTNDDLKLLKTLKEKFDEVIAACKSGRISEEQVEKASTIVLKIHALKGKLDEVAKKASEEEAAKVNLKQQPVLLAPSSVQSDNPSYTQQVTEKSGAVADSNITKYISLSNLKIYTETTDFLERHTLSFKALEDDHAQKSFRFECKKAVNIPVNSISGVSAEHLLDKYNKLYQLLSGQNVLVSGKVINASSHPQGIAFCMDLLAKKFVLQGDLMVSSSPESAFCYASVIISLWNEFPVLGNLVMAYFYRFCPYLVPYYIPRQVGESDEEFYKRQGYQYNEGQIEKQDKFLKRMTGIMRLYSAILITKPKKGQVKRPHSLRNGWRWLSSLLNLEPRVDITATMLHCFLETVGFEMETKYGRGFVKLNRIIMQKFLPSCRQKCTGGAVTRLELLLSEYEKNKKFKEPAGFFPYISW